jgi:hypothetical protein
VIRRRPIGLLLGCIALVLLSVLLAPKAVSRMVDFEVYWTAATRARAAEPLYRAEDGHYQFKYLPAFAVLAIPVSLVPLPAAKAVWFAVSVALVAVVLALSVAVLPRRLKPRWVLVAVTIVAMGKFYGHELVLGQVNLLFLFVVLAALVSLSAAREPTAGLLLALAVTVKPYAVIFGPWLVARRRAAAAAAFAAGLAAIAALPMLVYGVGGTVALHVDWWHTVAGSTAPNLTNADNVSIAGMYAKWLGDGALVRPLVVVTSLALLALAAFACARQRRLPQPHVLEGALLLTLVPLLSPQGWDYVFLVATPAIVLLANYESRLPTTVRILSGAAVLTIGLSLYDVMGRAFYARFMALSIVTVCFVILVAALVTVRLRRIA